MFSLSPGLTDKIYKTTTFKAFGQEMKDSDQVK
jgi:hypothetical protein